MTKPWWVCLAGWLILSVVSLILAGAASIQEACESYRLARLSPAEHFRVAYELCRTSFARKYLGPAAASACLAGNADEASQHLERIPASAPEYREASKLLASIRQRKQAQREEATRLANQSQQQSREQMLKNVQGVAHDSFKCGTSEGNERIMSFDNGHYWWSDDGRCAKIEQKGRDEDAKLSSYWPATVRVDTDMDSFWLPKEERTCQTYPGDEGRVAVVACNGEGSHRDHNIPVKFWGGVDRNTVSDWKCRREGEEFVCRAID